MSQTQNEASGFEKRDEPTSRKTDAADSKLSDQYEFSWKSVPRRISLLGPRPQYVLRTL